MDAPRGQPWPRGQPLPPRGQPEKRNNPHERREKRHLEGTNTIAGRGAKIGCIEVRVLSSGTWDMPPMLLLTCERTDSYGYLINAGEGLQRFSVEHKMRLVGKLQRVLLTRMSWETTGGLPGLLLTMSDGGQPGKVRIHGPSRLRQLVSSFRPFVVRHAMPQQVCETPEDWADGGMQTLDESGVLVTPVLLSAHTPPTAPSAPAPTSAPDVGAAAADEPSAKRQRRDESDDGAAAAATAAANASEAIPSGGAPSGGAPGAPSGVAMAPAAPGDGADPLGLGLSAAAIASGGAHVASSALPPGPVRDAREAPSLCWLLEMPPVPPKFNVAAAEALHVPSGPLRSALCAGQVLAPRRLACHGPPWRARPWAPSHVCMDRVHGMRVRHVRSRWSSTMAPRSPRARSSVAAAPGSSCSLSIAPPRSTCCCSRPIRS